MSKQLAWDMSQAKQVLAIHVTAVETQTLECHSLLIPEGPLAGRLAKTSQPTPAATLSCTGPGTGKLRYFLLAQAGGGTHWNFRGEG